MAARISEDKKQAYRRHRFELGQTVAHAAREAGVTAEWGRLYERRLKGERHANLTKFATEKPNLGGKGNLTTALLQGAPKRPSELCPEARKALTDFGYFRARYFGRSSQPWAEDAAHRLDALRAETERSYVVINVAPGVGKTTLLHDFSAWETCKTRWLRGLWGSANSMLAGRGTSRLRGTFDQAYRVRAKERDLLRGYSTDAQSTLVADFGRFRPIDGGIWQAGLFVVEQFDEQTYDEKEPTWSAFGAGTEEIGWRADLIVWDDLVTKDLVNATLEAIDRHRAWFDDVAESRLEPGGLFVLMGQRLGANDTYRYCLDKLVVDELEFESDDTYDLENRKHQYAHIVYPAHDPDICKGHEGANKVVKQLPWRPDGKGGCLLDPHKLSWAQCKIHMQDSTRWETVYQQGDSSAQDVLVQKIWIEGGLDNRTRENLNGCWDHKRRAVEVPKGYDGEPLDGLVSYMTVDPSPSRYWGCLWMAFDPKTLKRYVLDVFRDKLQAGQFLDVIDGMPVGLAHEWMMRSRGLGLPIRAMVVEANSAERFLLQYEHVRNWSSKYGVRIISHATHQNKADPRFGVQTIAGVWRQGLVRLPGLSRETVKPLVQEMTTYPQGSSDDLVMSFWFGEYNLTNLCSVSIGQTYRRQVPSWLRREAMAG